MPTPKRSEDFAAAADVAVKALGERHGASFGPGLWPWLAAAAVVLGVGALLVKRARNRKDAPLVGGVDGDDEAPGPQEPDRALQQE